MFSVAGPAASAQNLTWHETRLQGAKGVAGSKTTGAMRVSDQRFQRLSAACGLLGPGCLVGRGAPDLHQPGMRQFAHLVLDLDGPGPGFSLQEFA
jgi:hypothetical protein